MDKTVKILVIVFAIMGMGLFGYYWIGQWHTNTLNQAVEAEKSACLQRLSELEAQVQKLSETVDLQMQTLPDSSEMAAIFGSEKPLTGAKNQTTDCAKITSQAVSFFQYLDSKAYLVWPGSPNMRSEELFETVFRELSADPPTNVGEMENLNTLIRNVTHFYRVLGKDRINLIKEILASESAVMEPAMAVMFTWMTACNAGDAPASAQIRLKTLYQYSSYFLNTLGGRGYLLRRDSKQRMLVTYYALRILDMANETKLNSYGLDIRPHIDYLFYDINNQKGLLYRERYLTHLAALKDKYE